MIKIREYVKAESLEEAWELNQKRTNKILGGMLWLRMGNRNVQKAIDLSGLGLDTIEETEGTFSIGAMVTLRQIELHEGLNALCENLLHDAVCDIVGTQFRNLATVGGSIFGRFGFSDVMTAFLALDSYVELYKGGIVPMEEFVKRKRDNDILVRVIVKKQKGHFVYLSHRNTRTDFPVLTVAVSDCGGVKKAVIGARPGIARLYEIETMDDETAERLMEETDFQSNMRASDTFRRHLAGVLLRRAFAAVEEKE